MGLLIFAITMYDYSHYLATRFVFALYATMKILTFFFFFFQAEDGIRDRTVTGVQTCALPILTPRRCTEPIRRASAPENADRGTRRPARCRQRRRRSAGLLPGCRCSRAAPPRAAGSRTSHPPGRASLRRRLAAWGPAPSRWKCCPRRWR